MPLSITRLLLAFVLLCSILLSGWLAPLDAIENYTVRFEGHLNDEMRELVRTASQLIALEKNPPATEAALQRRAEADIPRFARALQSMAYYDVHTDLHIDFKANPAVVTFTINPGARFILQNFIINPASSSQNALCQCITFDDLDITLRAPAYPKTILAAEDDLLNVMANCGHPLARITKRDVKADLANHSISVEIFVDSGPKAYFGKTTISGNHDVLPIFFQKKITWQQGDVFDPRQIERTQYAMEASALFSSITITTAEKVEDDQSLPIHIDVVEGKHRSVGVGIGYSTLRHFGALAEFENRNMRQRGERLAFRTTFWKNTGYEGTLFYLIPDWRKQRQDLLSLLEARHEITEGYTETSFSLSLAVEQQVSDRLRTSYGITGELLRNTRSDNNGDFNLLKLPFSLKWVSVDDPIDPKSGYTLNYFFTPTAQVLHKGFAYFVNTLIGTTYLSIDQEQRWVLAVRCTLGSILGATRRTIPPSERFYAGSEETLRGYRYLTVSPLDREHNPLGGRSMMIYNLEWRWRMNESLGWVVFYDVGNVYDAFLPKVYHPQLQAMGVGVRYHTPVGPLRLDVAFPLQPRRHVDHRFEIYLSMGQTF